MKIAIVNQHVGDVMGGSEIQCNLIASELSSLGHSVFYIAVNGCKDKNYTTPYQVIAVNRHADEIASSVVNVMPDVVYWRFNKHCFFRASKKIKQAGIKIVFSVSHIRDVSQLYLERGLWNRFGFKGLRRGLRESWRLYREHRGFRFVDALVSNNADYLNKVTIARQFYIPNSMLTSAVSFSWPRPFCLWVANIKSRKQPEKYVELAHRLADKGMDFLMVGHIQDKAYAKLLSSGPVNFHYLGSKTLEEVNGILAESRFLVHTCFPEGFANNFIQAWLQRKTVVSLSFDPGGLLVGEGLGKYANDDVECFVNQVENLIDNPEYAKSLGETAYDYAYKNFRPHVNVKILEEVLNEVCEKTWQEFHSS